MNPETFKALNESIEHWEQNVAAKRVEDVSVGALDCALCRKFDATSSNNRDCAGCPVKLRTGSPNCEGSPYLDAYEARHEWMQNTDPRKENFYRNRFRKAAQAEVAFLRSLRPRFIDLPPTPEVYVLMCLQTFLEETDQTISLRNIEAVLRAGLPTNRVED